MNNNYYYYHRHHYFWKLVSGLGHTGPLKKTSPLCWAKQSAVVGRQHSSRIGYNVAADINSNVVDNYFLVWSLSRLLCYVGSGSIVATTLGV
jgi:hypothetical protein